MLAAGASVNLYMAHGGTNFGCTAGADHDGMYQPTVTSYDYDAPLDESGAPTEKFWTFRNVIGKYVDLPPVAELPPARTLPPGAIELTETVRLADDELATVRMVSAHPPTFEEIGIDHGLMRCRSEIPGPRQSYDLSLPGLADRAHLFRRW